MKRWIAVLLALTLLFCLTACGDDAVEEESDRPVVTPTGTVTETPTETPAEVKVPKFIGKMYYDEVENNEEYDHNFNFRIVWEDANDPDCKMGEVFKQEPAAGKTVKKGATVTLYVNHATPKDITLDVRAEIEGVHKNDMRKLLQDSGFVVKEITSSSDQVEADHVISININKGQAYPYGTEVTMVVSTGPSQRPPIAFPSIIIGEKKETAVEILKTYGFVGEIVYSSANYADERFAAKDTVMGVMLDGVLQETLPEEISAEDPLTLVVSSGLKNITIELDWPHNENGAHLNVSLNVSVVVDGKTNDALTEQYAPSYNPSFTTNKLSFVLTSHPRETEYYVSVHLKEASASGYKEYVRLLINPIDGTWSMVGEYQPISGITE